MLLNIRDLYDIIIGATDGSIGHVKDFYFDDTTWHIRYVVANTGSWLSGRMVLLSPNSFVRFHHGEKMLLVNVNRKQVESSPSIQSHEPISRPFEEILHRYYGWPGYWQISGAFLSLSNGTETSLTSEPAGCGGGQSEDSHLRSSHALTGYTVQGTDEEVGSVNGFMVDDSIWQMSRLVIETGHWYATKVISLSTTHITQISFDKSSIFLNLSKADIQRMVEREAAFAGPTDGETNYFTD